MAFSRKTRTAKQKPTKSTGQLTIITELIIPDHFQCPISLDLMKDPVTAPTGITYDRQSVEKWLEMGKSTCPVTNMELTVEDLIPNHSIRRMIQDWCVANQSYGIERIPTPRIPISSTEASEILYNISLACQNRDGERCLELVGRLKSLEKESERNRRCLVSNGAPIVLASAFRMLVSQSLKVLTEILEALVGLLPFNDEVVLIELGSTSESLDSIIKIMKHGDVGSKLNAVLMVKKMAATSKAIADKNGFVEPLLEFIREPVSMQATKASLVATFYFITDDERIATEFVKMGLIPLILEILIEFDKSLIEKSLAILDGLCDCDLGREIACANALTIPVLVKKLFRVSKMATEFAVSALWKLCKKCQGKCLVECLQVGLFQKLLLLLQVGCGDSAKEKATEMLKMMSGCSEKLECIDTENFKGLNRPSS
ncbi:U-box domain-containing protein 21-like [Dendrobium catenatum]|uniref:U-box domain-containing protein n=1 Tax=Dendrobium catenatum TaxID=906689 RepID=A0A2I0WCU9_9ASPA|nr:U-box domain-containing protein 21-like [Dendrobium catenatum]PKU73484.1 U-box domain-containing protein 21 [Dendrobium catenatum]